MQFPIIEAVKRVAAAALVLPLTVAGAAAVVGGAEDAGPLARSSIVLLSSKGGMCSAVVVAPDVLLTAAHCVTGADEHRVFFRDPRGQPVLIVPAAKAVHPAYEPKAVETRRRSIDLALVRVPQPLPAAFAPAPLAEGLPGKDSGLVVGGYGASIEDRFSTTGTFRVADLRAIEPYGPSKTLVWAEGRTKGAGACKGDSGGPLSRDGTSVFAVTTWSKGPGNRACGSLTQGILLGPQRAWIDATLAGWSRQAAWR